MELSSVQSCSKQPGTIYTFYSFKGGVGRSMALANIACLLAKSGRRVLIVDWDLEAPGLDRYFTVNSKDDIGKSKIKLDGSSNRTDVRKTKPGMLDLILERASTSAPKWRDCIIKAEVFDEGLPVSLITAGRDVPEYAERIQRLNWATEFENGLGPWLENLRTEWAKEYDFVLIDSRTGYSDVGGICTIILPDILVLLFTANEQSVNGAADVLLRARAAQNRLPVDRARLFAIPILSRDASREEHDRARAWRPICSEAMREAFTDWLPKEKSKDIDTGNVFHVLKIPYVAFWSFGERLPVVEREEQIEDPDSIQAAYKRLARFLESRGDWNEATGRADQRALAEAKELAAKAEAERIRAEEVRKIAELLRQKAEEERERLIREAALVEARTPVADQASPRGPTVVKKLAYAVVSLFVAASIFAVAWSRFGGKGGGIQPDRARAQELLTLALSRDNPVESFAITAELAGLPEPEMGVVKLRKFILSYGVILESVQEIDRHIPLFSPDARLALWSKLPDKFLGKKKELRGTSYFGRLDGRGNRIELGEGYLFENGAISQDGSELIAVYDSDQRGVPFEIRAIATDKQQVQSNLLFLVPDQPESWGFSRTGRYVFALSDEAAYYMLDRASASKKLISFPYSRARPYIGMALAQGDERLILLVDLSSNQEEHFVAQLWTVGDKENGTVPILDRELISVVKPSISPDGSRVAIAARQLGIEVWDTTNLEVVARIPARGSISSMKLSPHGKMLYIAGEHNDELCDLATASPQCIGVSRSSNRYDDDYVFDPVDRYVYEEIAKTSSFVVYDKLQVVYSRGGLYNPLDIAFSGSGRAAISPDQDKIEVLNADGDVLRKWSTNSLAGIERLEFSPDESRLLLVGNRRAQGWRIDIDEKRVAQMNWKELTEYVANTTTICLQPDRRQLILSESDNEAWERYEACERRYDRTPKHRPITNSPTAVQFPTAESSGRDND